MEYIILYRISETISVLYVEFGAFWQPSTKRSVIDCVYYFLIDSYIAS